MKTVAMAVPVLGLIWMAAVGRLALAETMWLAVWAVGLVDLAARIVPFARAARTRPLHHERGLRMRP
jgi:hypothetical protein